MTDEIPQIVRVVSTKNDGTPRDSYEVELLDHVGPIVRLRVPSGTPTYGKDGQMVEVEDNAIEIYFTDRWYNVWHLREHTTYPNLWYSNISMPAKFDGKTLRWVDLDLDVRCYLDGSLRVLDEDEFEVNRLEMGYTNEVVECALAALDEVLRLGKEGTFPFNYETQIKDGAFG